MQVHADDLEVEREKNGAPDPRYRHPHLTNLTVLTVSHGPPVGWITTLQQPVQQVGEQERGRLHTNLPVSCIHGKDNGHDWYDSQVPKQVGAQSVTDPRRCDGGF